MSIKACSDFKLDTDELINFYLKPLVIEPLVIDDIVHSYTSMQASVIDILSHFIMSLYF